MKKRKRKKKVYDGFIIVLSKQTFLRYRRLTCVQSNQAMWSVEKKILKNCAPKLLKKEFHKSGAKEQALHACWCDYLIIALPFWPSDENDWRALSLSVLCFDCMHRTKKQISSSQKLSQTHTRHSLFSLFPSEKLWVCIFFS